MINNTAETDYISVFCDIFEVKNAHVSAKSPVEESTVVKVSCLKTHRPSYVLFGEEEVTCQSNAEWSAKPECLIKCGMLYVQDLRSRFPNLTS